MKTAKQRRTYIRCRVIADPANYFAHCYTRMVQRRGQRSLPPHWRGK